MLTQILTVSYMFSDFDSSSHPQYTRSYQHAPKMEIFWTSVWTFCFNSLWAALSHMILILFVSVKFNFFLPTQICSYRCPVIIEDDVDFFDLVCEGFFTGCLTLSDSSLQIPF